MLTSVATTCPLLITILITTVKTTILSYLDYCYNLLTWLSIPTLVYLGLSLGFPYQILPGSFSSRHTAFLSLLAAHQTSSPHRAWYFFLTLSEISSPRYVHVLVHTSFQSLLKGHLLSPKGFS